ncbi:MAG: hypothetical protein RH859_11690 [Longimicrobiales bacterium]
MRRVPIRAAHLAVASFLAVMSPSAAAGQAAPLVLEARSGSAVPLGSFDDGVRPGEGTGAGFSFGLGFAYSGSGRRTTTFGFAQHRFPCRDAGCRVGESWVATAFDVGVRLNLATSGDVIPWIRLAGLAARTELDAHPDYRGDVTELGFGGEAGIGLYIGAFESVALNPGVRAAAVNTGLPGGGVLRMRYLVADLGLAVAF